MHCVAGTADAPTMKKMGLKWGTNFPRCVRRAGAQHRQECTSWVHGIDGGRDGQLQGGMRRSGHAAGEDFLGAGWVTKAGANREVCSAVRATNMWLGRWLYSKMRAPHLPHTKGPLVLHHLPPTSLFLLPRYTRNTIDILTLDPPPPRLPNFHRILLSFLRRSRQSDD